MTEFKSSLCSTSAFEAGEMGMLLRVQCSKYCYLYLWSVGRRVITHREGSLKTSSELVRHKDPRREQCRTSASLQQMPELPTEVLLVSNSVPREIGRGSLWTEC